MARHAAWHCQIKIGEDYQILIKESRSSSESLRDIIYIVQLGISKSNAILDKIHEATSIYIRCAGKVIYLRVLGSI